MITRQLWIGQLLGAKKLEPATLCFHQEFFVAVDIDGPDHSITHNLCQLFANNEMF